MVLSIIIPFYNEEDSLLILYEEIKSVMEQNGYAHELIFIDDGSIDKSADVVRDLINNDLCVTLIQFRRNFGKAAALQAGFTHAQGDYVITMDADLQDDPAEIPRFIEKLNEGYDLVSGWKYNRLDPLEKRIPSKLFNKTISTISGIKLHDFNCGFKAYKKDVVKAVDVYGELHRYIPVLANRYGFRITELIVNHRARKYGKSKYGIERYLRGLFDSVSVSFISRFHNKPMYLFGRMGIILMVLGSFICLFLFALWLSGIRIGDRPLLLLGVLLLVLGVQFFSSGLLADMIVDRSFKRTYFEYHIREIISQKEERDDG
jgi:glycosyltransferase involved in cell wall biosynthesis